MREGRHDSVKEIRTLFREEDKDPLESRIKRTWLYRPVPTQ
jgi:hypothetical protein